MYLPQPLYDLKPTLLVSAGAVASVPKSEYDALQRENEMLRKQVAHLKKIRNRFDRQKKEAYEALRKIHESNETSA